MEPIQQKINLQILKLKLLNLWAPSGREPNTLHYLRQQVDTLDER